MLEYYLGRQPIFNADLEVYGYELLYRPDDPTELQDMAALDGDKATSQVFINSFMEMGLAKVVGQKCAFVNLTRKFILNHDSLLPPACNQLVLEVLEDITVDEALVAAVKELKSKGYTIALDDYTIQSQGLQLVPLADIIKLELPELNKESLAEHVKILRQYPVKLLAEKVETLEEFKYCKSLGIDYFQGYFLSKPRIIRGQRLPANRVSMLQTMALLQQSDIDVAKLDNVLSQDVSMSYKLLRYINSAAFTTSKEITSIRHAIVYLGSKEIRNWASLILLSDIDDKPGELLLTALIRGRMCEAISDEWNIGKKESAFIVGLFSMLDAMMNVAMDELLAMLPVADDIRQALIAYEGDYGHILAITLAYERDEWDGVDMKGITDASKLTAIYIAAVESAETALSNISSDI